MKVAMIQATYRAAEPVVRAFGEIAPEIETVQFVNEQMLASVNAHGGVRKEELRMFARLMFEAMESDADCILVCCSIFCSYVPLMRSFTDKEIVAINDPMLRRAAEFSGKIGVVSTTPTSAPHTQEKIEGLMTEPAKAAFLHEVVPEAARALRDGKPEVHDRLIAEAVQRLEERGASVIVLSQITMASAKGLLCGCSVPVLTSTEEGARYVIDLLGAKNKK